jgi:hypothetical protein
VLSVAKLIKNSNGSYSITGLQMLEEPKLSSTGKSLVLLTHGEKIAVGGDVVTVQVNVFKKAVQ